MNMDEFNQFLDKEINIIRLDKEIIRLDTEINHLDKEINYLDKEINYLDKEINHLDKEINHLDKEINIIRLDDLPNDIIREILDYIEYPQRRNIIKKFKLIADEKEVNNFRPLYVSRININNYVQEVIPNIFSIYSGFSFNSFVKIDNSNTLLEYRNMRSTIIFDNNGITPFWTYYLYPWDIKSRKYSSQFMFPSYEILKYRIKQHPLSKLSDTFYEKCFKLTSLGYRDFIKSYDYNDTIKLNEYYDYLNLRYNN